ncbi:MAG: aminotransferase class V-fold PLP-dependent enzyme, partial [Candidatus Heimdallarchaeota archaeon]|nr:aminotransferase class V-fold PLP-dependent enzyme [Candidatus Heimdallarchaeota archaeon]
QSSFSTKINNTVRTGLYKSARQATEKYIEAKEIYSKYLGGVPENYAWIPNADYGWNIFLNSLLLKEEKPNIVTSVFEHHSMLAPLIHLKKLGKINLTLTGIEDEFNLTEHLRQMQNKSTFVFGHVSPLLGLYRDIAGISEVAREKSGVIAIDYSRSIIQSNINLNNHDIDIGIMDGSIDLLGPQGSGLLFVSEDYLTNMYNPFPGSGGVRFVTESDYGQMRNIERFETGTPNIAGMIGLARSLKYIAKLGNDAIALHRIELMKYFLDRLQEIERHTLVDPLLDYRMGNPNRSSIACFNIVGIGSHDVSMLLDEIANVQVRSGMICTHAGMLSLDLEGTVQVSTHIYNTIEDIDKLIEGLSQIQNMF